jgi:hypothetical protein
MFWENKTFNTSDAFVLFSILLDILMLIRKSGRISGIWLLDWPDIRQHQYPVHP